MIKNPKKYKKSTGTFKTNKFCLQTIFQKTILPNPSKLTSKICLICIFLRFWPLLVQNGYFLKIPNLCAIIEKPILIFSKKNLEIKVFIYNIFFRFLSFFLKRNTLAMFSRIILKKEKKMDFLQKTCGFYSYFEIVFWHQRGALKNGIPIFWDNPYDF